VSGFSRTSAEEVPVLFSGGGLVYNDEWMRAKGQKLSRAAVSYTPARASTAFDRSRLHRLTRSEQREERHLRRTLTEYVAHSPGDRNHRALTTS